MNDPRRQLQGTKRLVIKVGTAVVTRADGRLALTRLGNLVESIRSLRAEGRDVVLVSSGSIGLGQQYLGLDGPLPADDCAVAAAAGQSLLMEKYRQLFGNLDLRCAQVLLTEEDFFSQHRLGNLERTMARLLALGVVPVVNENDAVTSAIKMEHKRGVFYDNDRLAALTAKAIQADLLLILSNVDALYDRAPSEPDARRISVFASNQNLSFGHRSDQGRGGMESKVVASRRAQNDGITTVIASGETLDTTTRVLAGEDIGTIFPGRRQG